MTQLKIIAILALANAALACSSQPQKASEVAIKDCESYIISNLKAPATYTRISADSQFWKRPAADTKMTKGNPREYAPGEPIFSPTTEQLSDPSTVLDVVVKYDAQNSFGVPLRGERHCQFRADKQSQFSNGILNLAKNKRADSQFCLDKALAGEQPLICQEDRPEILQKECCLPNKEYVFATKGQR